MGVPIHPESFHVWCRLLAHGWQPSRQGQTARWPGCDQAGLSNNHDEHWNGVEWRHLRTLFHSAGNTEHTILWNKPRCQPLGNTSFQPSPMAWAASRLPEAILRLTQAHRSLPYSLQVSEGRRDGGREKHEENTQKGSELLPRKLI